MHSIVTLKAFPFRGRTIPEGATMTVENGIYDYLMKKWGPEYFRPKYGMNEHQLAARALMKESPAEDEKQEKIKKPKG